MKGGSPRIPGSRVVGMLAAGRSQGRALCALILMCSLSGARAGVVKLEQCFDASEQNRVPQNFVGPLLLQWDSWATSQVRCLALCVCMRMG
jgi:hypothetical protein